jgi:MerR family transcriptional regulator, copper efflux regulator
MAGMTIGQVARRAGVGIETVRFYERRGLIAKPPRPNGGFRHYADDVVGRIRFIREAQRLGFSLEEIRELLNLQADPAADASKVRERALAKLAQVDDKIAQLERMGGALRALLAVCPGEGELGRCSIMEALAGADGSQALAAARRRARSVI